MLTTGGQKIKNAIKGKNILKIPFNKQKKNINPWGGQHQPEQYLSQIWEGQWVGWGHPPVGVEDGLAGAAVQAAHGVEGGAAVRLRGGEKSRVQAEVWGGADCHLDIEYLD